jgi:jumonji domain-containing protein 7
MTPLDPPSSTPWIPVNPLCPDFVRYPRFANACPITVTVNEGDMLYLPGKLIVIKKEVEGKND